MLLFAEVKPYTVLQWLLVVALVAVVASVVYKSAATYRKLKRDKQQRQSAGNPSPLAPMEPVGDSFRLHADVVYKVGNSSQLHSGAYLLRGDNGRAASVNINGTVRDVSDETVILKEGDLLSPVDNDILIKPKLS